MLSVADYQTLLVERSDEGFATLVLNRPDKLNALSIRLRQELAAAIDALEADPAIRVLILTGAGRAFTAGLDLDEWAAPGVVAAAAYEHDAVAALQRFSGPVIGAINGLAITGGVELALACDVLIASSEARFADTHVAVGLLPGWGGSVRLARRIGLHRAKELALTGRFLNANEALSWGLVNRVVAPEQLRPEAEAMARQMLAGVPETLVAYKRLLDDEAGTTLEAGLRLERAASLANNVPVSRDQIDTRLARLRRGKA
jgi:enoyl-CoA hydratase